MSYRCDGVAHRGSRAAIVVLAARRAQELHDHAAGDTAAGIAGRIGLVVVDASMDHYRRTVGPQYQIGHALLQRDCGIHHLDYKLAALWDMKIRHVAGVVTLWRHEAMLLAARVENGHPRNRMAARIFQWRGCERRARRAAIPSPIRGAGRRPEFASSRLLRRPCPQRSSVRPSQSAPTPALPRKLTGQRLPQ